VEESCPIRIDCYRTNRDMDSLRDIYMRGAGWMRNRDYLKKGESSIPGILICRMLSIPLVWGFVRLGIRPNAISILSLIVIVLFLIGFVGRRFEMAGGLLFMGALLDFCDGMVARRQKSGSTFGRWLDYALDRVKTFLILVLTPFVFPEGGILFLAGSAFFLLLVKEVMLRLNAFEKPFEAHGYPPWRLIFGRFDHVAKALVQNDPWHLVMTGLLAVCFGRSGMKIGLLIYAGTIVIDALVFLRAHLNLWAPIDIGTDRILILRSGYSIKGRLNYVKQLWRNRG